MSASPSTPRGWDRLARGAVGTGLGQLVRRQLRGVWVRGSLPTGGAVWASNHHSWWDYFVARAALTAAGRVDVAVLVDSSSIRRRRAWASGGAIGTDRLRSALQSLGDSNVLVVFPEGALLPAGGLGELRPGAGWLAARSGAELHPVATRVVMRGQQAAEAYLDIGPPVDPAGLADALRARLSGLDGRLGVADPMRPVPGFDLVVRGKRSWHEHRPDRAEGR